MKAKQKFTNPSDLLEQTKDCKHTSGTLIGSVGYEYYLEPIRQCMHRMRICNTPQNERKYCAMGLMFKAMGHDPYDEGITDHHMMMYKYPEIGKQLERWNQIWDYSINCNDELKGGSFWYKTIVLNDSLNKDVSQIQEEFRKVGL